MHETGEFAEPLSLDRWQGTLLVKVRKEAADAAREEYLRLEKGKDQELKQSDLQYEDEFGFFKSRVDERKGELALLEKHRADKDSTDELRVEIAVREQKLAEYAKTKKAEINAITVDLLKYADAIRKLTAYIEGKQGSWEALRGDYDELHGYMEAIIEPLKKERYKTKHFQDRMKRR